MGIKYKRVLLKLSGEYMGGEAGQGFDYPVINSLADQICQLHDQGVEVAVVVGGGNIFRGMNSAQLKMERVAADHMGMLATIINALCLQESLERNGKKTRVMTGLEVREVAEIYVKRKAVRHLEKGRIVIFGGGTGNPYFSTDTAAVLRGQEIQAEVVIKGTMVDGIYDKDPKKFSDAVMYKTLDYTQVLNENLQVMDSTAFTFCRDNLLPLCVLNIGDPTALIRFVQGEDVGTLIDH